MLQPEIESGNIEYKRLINYKTEARLFSLTSQLQWRLNEGDGCCYYYLGVNDDGSIYPITINEYNLSINCLSEMCSYCDCKIVNINKCYYKNNYYYKIRIEKNNNKKEYRILIVGNSGVGKTTFLSNLIKGKINKNYIVNHKHEMETGKTSSINYYNINFDNNIYLFFDSPGDEKYKKTFDKIINNIIFDLIIVIGDNYNVQNYFLQNDCKIINLNDICDKDFFTELIDRNKVMENIKKHINHKIMKYSNNKFNILQYYYNNDIGYILCGFFIGNKMRVGDIYYLYTKENKFQVKINSIYRLGKNVIKVNGLSTFSVNISFIDEYDGDKIIGYMSQL
jgi:signal recognition particle receptor subunit beta